MSASQTVTERPGVPAHVPPHLVYRPGITEREEFLAAPHKFMAELHDRYPPIVYSISEHNNPAWQLLKYQDAYFVLRHPAFFTSAGSGPFPRDPDDWWNIIPLEIEPPHHRKYRAPVDPLVSPKAITALEGAIRSLACELIDQFVDRGECEFARDFGRPLPVGVIRLHGQGAKPGGLGPRPRRAKHARA